MKHKFEEEYEDEPIKIKSKSKKSINYKKELEDNEINISLTEDEVINIYSVMKKLLTTGKIKVEEFSSKCKYCQHSIKMMNHGFGWKPFSLDNKPHKCDEGLRAWKKRKEEDDE